MLNQLDFYNIANLRCFFFRKVLDGRYSWKDFVLALDIAGFFLGSRSFYARIFYRLALRHKGLYLSIKETHWIRGIA